MKKIKFIYAIFLLTLCACSKHSDELKPNTPIGNFEALWEIIDTKYCYIDKKNIDWQAIGDYYRPQVEALDNNDYWELFDLLASMLDSLCDGHVNLYSDFDISRNIAWYEGYPENYNTSVVYGERYLGQDYKRAGGLSYALIDDGNIGYIRYNSFSDYFSNNNMAYVLMYFSNCQGLIIDVRSNGGGSLEYAKTLASTFFSENTVVGYMQHKTGDGHSDFSELIPMTIDTAAMRSKWLRPVAVLCNREAYSATNFFANAMQYAPYATLIGGKTGGGGGMPLSYELPNGWLIRLSSVPMYNAEKQSTENGIEPDIAINLTTAMTDLGYDDIIEQAIQELKK